MAKVTKPVEMPPAKQAKVPAPKPAKAKSAVADETKARAAKAKAAEKPELPEVKWPDGFTPPKKLSPAAAADAFFQTREQRLALSKEVDKLQALETAYKAFAIRALANDQELSGVGGKLCAVQLTEKSAVRVSDWNKVYASIVADYNMHVKKKDGMEAGAFAMLQRRIGDTHVKAMWERGLTVDGVESFDFYDLSVTKL